MKVHASHRDARQLARPTYPKMETPGTVDAARGFGGNEEENAANFDMATAQRKRFETLRAKAALSGFELNDHGTTAPMQYSATKWGFTRELGSLEAVASWLTRAVGTPT